LWAGGEGWKGKWGRGKKSENGRGQKKRVQTGLFGCPDAKHPQGRPVKGSEKTGKNWKGQKSEGKKEDCMHNRKNSSANKDVSIKQQRKKNQKRTR